MPTPVHSSTEWRVCAEALPGEWLGWRVRVYVRTTRGDMPPGGWQLVKDGEYKAPQGQVTHSYWKDLIKSAAR